MNMGMTASHKLVDRQPEMSLGDSLLILMNVLNCCRRQFYITPFLSTSSFWQSVTQSKTFTSSVKYESVRLSTATAKEQLNICGNNKGVTKPQQLHKVSGYLSLITISELHLADVIPKCCFWRRFVHQHNTCDSYDNLCELAISNTMVLWHPWRKAKKKHTQKLLTSCEQCVRTIAEISWPQWMRTMYYCRTVFWYKAFLIWSLTFQENILEHY